MGTVTPPLPTSAHPPAIDPHTIGDTWAEDRGKVNLHLLVGLVFFYCIALVCIQNLN